MLFCPNPELCQQQTRVVAQRLLTTERCPLFKHPSRGLLVKQGVHLTAGSLGTTWLWSHRPTRRQSDDVRLGYNGLRGLQHMEKVGHKVWSRCVFANSKLDFRRVAASIYTCHQFYVYSSANTVEKSCLYIYTTENEFFLDVSFVFPYFRFYLFIFWRGLAALYVRASALPLIHPAEEGTEWGCVSLSDTMQRDATHGQDVGHLAPEQRDIS